MTEALCGIIAGIAGLAVSYLNSRITSKALSGGGGRPALLLSARALISAAFIGTLFLAGSLLDLPVEALLIGGAIGLSVGLIAFTVRLMAGFKNEGREERDDG